MRSAARERALREWSGNDPLAAWMIKRGIALTRENYFECAFAGLDEPTDDEYAEWWYALPNHLVELFERQERT